MDVRISDTALFHKAANRKSAPRRMEPARISDTDETGAAVKFQSQTLKVARYCVRRKLEEEDVPQGSAAGDNQRDFDCGMPQPLALPAPHGNSLDLAVPPEEPSADTSMHKEQETQSTASPK